MSGITLNSRSASLHVEAVTYRVSSAGVGVPALSSGSQVSISPEAQALAASTASAGDRAKAERLRAEVTQIDFTNTTQAEPPLMANKLLEAGEITADESAAFVATAHNAYPPRKTTDRFDANAHFAEMEQRAQDVNRDGSNNWAVDFSKQITQLVKNVQSFASSDRLHVNPTV